MYKGENQKKKQRKTRNLLLELTGVTTINIIGTTIHTGLVINICGKMYPPSDKQWENLRNKLSEGWVLIVDEILSTSEVE